MGRAQRVDFEGAWHHLMNRGSDRQDIFSDDIDHRRYLSLVGDAVERGQLEVHAHVEMTNHFHLLGRSPLGRISAAMHGIESEYARWYNDRHQRTGPLFTGRFVAVAVESDEQLLTVARYIHRNPLDKVSREALFSYPWSSYPVYLGCADRPDWLTTDVLTGLAGTDVEALRAFVECDLPSDRPKRSHPPSAVPLDQLVETLGQVTDIAPAAILHAAPGTAWARQLLAMLAVELRAAPTKELAQVLGLASDASIRVLARRGRVRTADDPSFAQCRTAVLASLGYAVPGTA
jgi:REP element-mobilizing transposase RayT